ncbi:MAG: hypothetical protein Q7U91_01005 [Sideroxyarcus sp.]|nr:hypothetical protein [Sideroxyarcus sp.]
MRSSRLFLPLFLLFALLFAQQGAVMHGIAHTLAEQAQDQSLPHDGQCELCAAYAHIGSAVGSSDVDFDFGVDATATLTTHSATFRSIAFAAFAARAPPYSA